MTTAETAGGGDRCADAPLSFGDRPPPWVRRRVVTIDPGGVRRYVEAEWRDSLVIVETGELVLESAHGGSATFRTGDMLWLVGLPVARLRNDGVEPTVLVAVARRRPTRRSSTMPTTTPAPTAEIDERFSSPGAAATPWVSTRDALDAAEISWISTVRADGRPHVTPLMTVMIDDAVYVCTGPTEQKARNLESNPHVALTTGANSMSDGIDVVVEGEAVRITDETTLTAAAARYQSKYGWTFEARDGALHSDDGGEAYLFRVAASRAFAFGKGEERFSQTRYRFG